MPEFDDALELLPPAPVPAEDGFALEDTVEAADVLEQQGPAPLGRGEVFDFGAERFIVRGQRPQETRGVATLLSWIDKYLHTRKGALAIHPPWFGITFDLFGQPVQEFSVGDLRRDLEDLTEHPNIADVVDVELVYQQPLDEAVVVQITVLTDPPVEDTELLRLNVTVGG